MRGGPGQGGDCAPGQPHYPPEALLTAALGPKVGAALSAPREGKGGWKSKITRLEPFRDQDPSRTSASGRRARRTSRHLRPGRWPPQASLPHPTPAPVLPAFKVRLQ